MLTHRQVQAKRGDILRLAAEHRTANVRLFGSVVRNEERPGSDVDFLVTAQPGCSLLDLGGLLMDLQDLLGNEVDVVVDSDLKPRLRERILDEAVPL